MSVVEGEGFCNAEVVNNVSWPETQSGSDPVVVACPENKNRNVTRECINSTWSEADYGTCMSFSDLPVSLQTQYVSRVYHYHCPYYHYTQTIIMEDNVVMALGLLSSVVSGTPVSEQSETNADLIADRLEQTALLLNQEGIQLSTEEMMEVITFLPVLVCLSYLSHWLR